MYWTFSRSFIWSLGRTIAGVLLLFVLFGAADKIAQMRAEPFECPDDDYAGKPQYARTNPKTLRESCEDAIRQADRLGK